MTTSPILPPLSEAFFQEITKHHAPSAKIVKKSESLLMKVIGFFVKPFNPDFQKEFITTIGTTIYVPDGFFTESDAQCFSVLVHETQHIIDYLKAPIRFTLGYLFPQVLSLLALLGLFAFCHPIMALWCLALVFLAPIPAPFRYQSELNGYRASILLGLMFYHYTDSSMKQINNWIVSEMTTSSYYFAWPFAEKIQKDLLDLSFMKEPRYQEVLTFLQRKGKI